MVELDEIHGISNFSAKKLQIGIMERVSRQVREEFPLVADNLRMSSWEDRCTRDLVISLRSFLLEGHKEVRTDTRVLKTPSNPWQLFKEMYMPEWFVKRWPVTYITQDVPVATHHYFMCPHMNVPPDRPEHLYWLMDGFDYNKRLPHK